MSLDLILIIISSIFLIVGLLGCIVPAVPGPPFAMLGLIVLGCCSHIEFSWAQYAWWLGLTAIVSVLDFVVPIYGAKTFKSSRWGTRGSLIGTIIGLFFLPAGIILGPFLGAVIGEFLGGYDSGQALKSGLGSLIGFIVGTALKFATCAYFIYEFVCTVF